GRAYRLRRLVPLRWPRGRGGAARRWGCRRAGRGSCRAGGWVWV
ncbi:MAG: hypothetical protein AVDCRST_MAG93-8933, partial [uncultured Chloroflexia bacterium]